MPRREHTRSVVESHPDTGGVVPGSPPTRVYTGIEMTKRARATIAAALCLASPAAFPAAGVAQEESVPVSPGLYASRQYVSNRARTRPSNRYLRVRTTSVLLHTVRASGDGLVVETRYCSVEQAPLGRVRTSLGPAFVAAMPVLESSLSADPGEGGPGAVRIADRAMVLGADLDDPAYDPLPTDDDDPRVVDSDGDGHPGVTVEVDGFVSGQVYLVQRLVRGLRGTVGSDGRMTGTVTGEGDQVVIGASNAILKTFTPKFEHNPDPKRNTFVWVPVPEDSTCESVVAGRDRLFGED